MRQKKVLISISIILILIFSIIFFNGTNIKVTSNDIKSIKSKEEKINIVDNEEITTTRDIGTVSTKNDNDITTTTKKIIDTTKTDIVTATTKKVEKITTTKLITKTTTTTKKTTTKEITTTTPSAPKTLREQNIDLINDIKNIFGYDVSYNDEEFWFNGVSSTLLTDEKKANEALIDIKNKSSIFPTGFFRTFQGYNGFRIILYDHIEGAAGVASYEIGNDNFIAIDVNAGFLGRVFYHETFHIMEQYIRYKSYGKTNPFNNWNSLNPSGFTYQDDDTFTYTIYDYNDFYKYDNPGEITFVSKYAKTNDREDRAELFADLMFRAIKKDYMTQGCGINNKAKELSLILREYFPNSEGARWERYIEWS